LVVRRSVAGLKLSDRLFGCAEGIGIDDDGHVAAAFSVSPGILGGMIFLQSQAK